MTSHSDLPGFFNFKLSTIKSINMKSIEEMKSEIASAQEEVQKLYAKLDFRSPEYKRILVSVRKAKKRLETLKSCSPTSRPTRPPSSCLRR